MVPLKVALTRAGQVWAGIREVLDWRQAWGFALGLGLCSILWLAGPQGVWSQTAHLQVIVQGQDYAQMVEASRPQVWQMLADQFTQPDEPVHQVTVEVMGQQNSLQLPLLLVTMTREQWQTRPSPQQMEQFAQFYTSAISLLSPTGISAPLPSPSPGSAPRSGSGELTLIGSQPAPQAQQVSVNEEIRLWFDQILDPDLQQLQLSISPQVELGFDVQAEQLLIQPLQLLDYSTDYRISLAALGQQPLSSPIEIEFRTEPQYTYQQDVKPLLQASCVGCHQALGRQRRQRLDTYETVMDYVIPQDPSSPLIDPRWTRRHARPRRLSQIQPGDPIPEFSGIQTPNPAANPLATSAPEEEPASLSTVGEAQNSLPILDTTGAAGSPELAYVRRLGIPESRLGAWTPEEIEIVRTWIVQDGAPETRVAASLDELQ